MEKFNQMFSGFKEKYKTEINVFKDEVNSRYDKVESRLDNIEEDFFWT